MNSRDSEWRHRRGWRRLGVAAPTAAAFLLSACGAGPESGAATVITDGLRAPSTYSQASSKKVWSGKGHDGNDAYVVRVEYDAQNGFGAMIRDCQYVAFQIKGKQVLWRKNTAMVPCNMLPSEEKTIEWQVKMNFEA